MVNFRKKLFLIPILFLIIFFTFSQAVFSGEFGYEVFQDKSTMKFGFKDSSGKVIIPTKFDVALPFVEGLAPVYVSKLGWGYINKIGKVVIPYKFNFALFFSEGLAKVKIGNYWGYINKTGKVIIPAKFDLDLDNLTVDNSGFFTEGVAVVKIGNKWGYINKTGKVVIPAKFDRAYDFKGGLAKVKIGNDEAKINTQGVVVSICDNNNTYKESESNYTAPQNTYTPQSNNNNSSTDEYYKKKKEVESKNKDCKAEVEKEYNSCYEGCKSLSDSAPLFVSSDKYKCIKACDNIRWENNRTCDKIYK